MLRVTALVCMITPAGASHGCPAAVGMWRGHGVGQRLFYSGRADLGETVRDLAAHLRLNLPSEHGQYYGQARWDALRRCHVGMFDLRGCRPGLVQTDAAAGVALAATAYELGLASALGKPVVIVTRPDDALPFDIDIVPCEISGDTPTDKQALTGALDHAWYGRQRTIGSSSLAETFAFLDQITQDHPRRRMLEATASSTRGRSTTHRIHRQRQADPARTGPGRHAGNFPRLARPLSERSHAKRVHVMPFSEPWSNAVRDTVRATCNTHAFAYKRGDEADEDASFSQSAGHLRCTQRAGGPHRAQRQRPHRARMAHALGASF